MTMESEHLAAMDELEPAAEPLRDGGVEVAGITKAREPGARGTAQAARDPRADAIIRDMPGLRAQLTRAVGNRDLAEDLLQDAVVTALQKLKSGELASRAEIDGFVYRTALNHLRNHRRKAGRCVAEADCGIWLADPNGEAASEPLASAQWARVAREVLCEVGRRDREILVRFYLRDEPKTTLCAEFGLSELHFNRVVFRARERFRSLLERRGYRKTDFLSILAVL
jgi:RNA polymerase sigma-70 factor, ECF subfamily